MIIRIIDTAELTPNGIISEKDKVYLCCNPLTRDIISKIKENKIVIKANKNGLSTIEETLQAIETINSFIGEQCILTRLDLAYDLLESFERNESLFQLFLACLMGSRDNKQLGRVYQTIINDYEKNSKYIGNLKIKKGNRETSIYACYLDRDRNTSSTYPITALYDSKIKNIHLKAHTRLETRSLKIENSLPYKEKIIKEITKYYNELNKLIYDLEYTNLFEEIENIIITRLIDDNDLSIENIRFFVYYADKTNQFYTKRIFEEVLKQIGYTKDINNFIREFRRDKQNIKTGEERLQFIFKDNIIQLTNKLIQPLRKALKSS